MSGHPVQMSRRRRVTEYVWGAAWSFFDKADLDGNARQVAAGIR
jgi:hypothetical protein